MTPYDAKRKVHRGIYEQYSRIRSQLLDDCYNFSTVNIYGYSMGAGITTLATQDATYHRNRDQLKCTIKGIAFEPPRTLGTGFKGDWEQSLTYTFNWLDPVVHLPAFLRFRHYGKRLTMKIKGNIFKQHGHASIMANLEELKDEF